MHNNRSLEGEKHGKNEGKRGSCGHDHGRVHTQTLKAIVPLGYSFFLFLDDARPVPTLHISLIPASLLRHPSPTKALLTSLPLCPYPLFTFFFFLFLPYFLSRSLSFSSLPFPPTSLSFFFNVNVFSPSLFSFAHLLHLAFLLFCFFFFCIQFAFLPTHPLLYSLHDLMNWKHPAQHTNTQTTNNRQRQPCINTGPCPSPITTGDATKTTATVHSLPRPPHSQPLRRRPQ